MAEGLMGIVDLVYVVSGEDETLVTATCGVKAVTGPAARTTESIVLSDLHKVTAAALHDDRVLTLLNGIATIHSMFGFRYP